ncbi:MAG: glycosyltransferase, partial [Desulfobulbaceae bacterium]|nr:glycosyltransferase [Desulfobulbaceae bacterium]
MTSEPIATKQQTSYLEEGNKEFREKKYPAAIGLYLLAYQGMPQLKEIVTFKIVLAWRRYKNLLNSKDRLFVALIGSDPAVTSGRLDTFSKLYGNFTEVHIVNEEFSQFNTSSWLSNSKSTFSIRNLFAQNENIFLKQAIQKVVANPFDIVHLFEPSVSGIFFAMLYKLICGAKVLVDIDERQLNPSVEMPQDIRDYLEKKQDLDQENTGLKRFTLDLAKDIDSITISNMILQQQFGGEIIGEKPRGRSHLNRAQLRQLQNSIEESDKDSSNQEVFIDKFLVAFWDLLSAEKTAFLKRVSDASSINDTSEGDSNSFCVVRLEEANLKFASGWAIYAKDKNKRIFLKVNLNDSPLHIVNTSRYRDDIKKERGGEGFVGYSAEMTEYLDFSGHSEISVSPISHVMHEKDSKKSLTKKLPCLLKGQHFKNVNEKAKELLQRNCYSFNHKLNKAADSFSVSIIILNLNGLNVLQRCLESIYEHTGCDFEVIVIDHGSTDGSVEFLKHSKLQNLKSYFRGKNYSFSSSNNFAAQKTQGDILVFMNNDMIIVDDAISAMARTALHSDFGVVGIKLWDMPQGLPVEISKSLGVVQHLGVHFRDCHRENIVEAYETRQSTFWSDEPDFFETPAVTAAMMALTKSDFLLVGGFDEDYFYGQEDVDFCLKYMRSNHKKTGVLLSHGAYHARGLTRYDSSVKMNSSL